MYKRFSAFLFFFFFVLQGLQAQKEEYRHEFSFTNDNDVYLMTYKDRYYSNGLLLHFRFLPKADSRFGKRRNPANKRIIDLELTQKFYTPINLSLTNPDDFDRPYAGWLYAGFTIADFPKPNQRIEYGLELGTTGKPSGAEVFQKRYHTISRFFPTPRGWDFQIAAEVVMNLKINYMRQWVLADGILDMVTTSSAMVGSAFTNFVQRADLRVGRLQPLNESGFANALIGERTREFRNHFYFFTGYGYQWTLHDITIQGSLWNDNSPHTEKIFSNVRHLRIGWATSGRKTTFRMTYHWLSKEVIGGQNHSYLSLELLLRFKSK